MCSTYLLLKKAFLLDWFSEIRSKSIEEDFKSSVSFLPSFEDLTAASRASYCLGIYFGCFKSLGLWLGIRDKRDHCLMLSKSAHERPNCYLRVLGSRSTASVADGYCEETKNGVVLVPGKIVFKHHIECIMTSLNLQTSTWKDHSERPST